MPITHFRDVKHDYGIFHRKAIAHQLIQPPTIVPYLDHE